jgi:hypothetical protein
VSLIISRTKPAFNSAQLSLFWDYNGINTAYFNMLRVTYLHLGHLRRRCERNLTHRNVDQRTPETKGPERQSRLLALRTVLIRDCKYNLHVVVTYPLAHSCAQSCKQIFNPLKPKLVWIVLKNSARASKRTPHFTITAIDLLTMFKEMIPVYAENNTKPTNTERDVMTGKADGIYSYLLALKG